MLHEGGQQETLKSQFLFDPSSLRDFALQLFVGRSQRRCPLLDAPLQLLLGVAQRVFRAFPLRNVSHHRLDDAAVLQVDAGQQHIGGEVGAVGATMHPFKAGRAVAVGLGDPCIRSRTGVRAVRLLGRRHFAGMSGDEILLRPADETSAAWPGCIP